MDELGPTDAAAFARLAQDLLAEPTAALTLQRIVTLAVETIGPCDRAGITLTTAKGIRTPAASDPRVAELDAAQLELGEGPCLDTARTDETFLIEDTSSEQRWPRWCERALADGVSSVLSVQLSAPRDQVGALNLYAKQVSAFDSEAITTAQIYGIHAGNALVASDATDNLQTALSSRHVIGVAQGMLMLRYGLSEEQAFSFLSRHSQNHNTKLRDVAAHVVVELGKERWPES